MPAQDSKVSELSKLKSKLIELENQLKEEKKITMKLREKSESKIQQIMLTDTLIAEEIERFFFYHSIRKTRVIQSLQE